MKKCGLVSLSITLLTVTLVGVTPISAVVDYNANGMDCSEVCFLDAIQRVSDNQGERRQIEKLMKLVNRLKEIRIKNKVTAVLRAHSITKIWLFR